MSIFNLCVTVGMKVGDTSDKDSGQPRKVRVTRIKALPILTSYTLELYIFSYQCPAGTKEASETPPGVKAVLLRF